MRYKLSFIISSALNLIVFISYFVLKNKEIASQKIYLGISVAVLLMACYILVVGFFTKILENSEPKEYGGFFMILYFIGGIVLAIANGIFLVSQADLPDYIWQMKVWPCIWFLFVLFERVVTLKDTKAKKIVAK